MRQTRVFSPVFHPTCPSSSIFGNCFEVIVLVFHNIPPGTVYMLTDSIFVSWCVEGILCLILDLETRSKSLAYPFLIMRTMIWLIRWMNKNLCPAEALHSLPLLILNPFIVLDYCLGMFAQFSNLNCCLGWLVFYLFLISLELWRPIITWIRSKLLIS